MNSCPDARVARTNSDGKRVYVGVRALNILYEAHILTRELGLHCFKQDWASTFLQEQTKVTFRAHPYVQLQSQMGKLAATAVLLVICSFIVICRLNCFCESCCSHACKKASLYRGFVFTIII
jgi:hypothetical protein